MIAPSRERRPGVPTASGLEPPSEEEQRSCPFCEGREERTPAETFALGVPGRRPNTPGWSVRVVPNLYPVFQLHEVVVSTPRHVRSFAELATEEIGNVAAAWSARARAWRQQGHPATHAFLNEGREAGASLAHSHTQLVGLREPPPLLQQERGEGCAACHFLATERSGGRLLVAERAGLLVVVAYGGRLPYELVIAPLDHPHESAFEDSRLPHALELLAEAIRRLHAVEGMVPLNAWLHDGAHWHLELLPRLAVMAGIELGAGIYVNSLAPEVAAEALRGARPEPAEKVPPSARRRGHRRPD